MKQMTKRLLALLLACCLAGCSTGPGPGPGPSEAETLPVPGAELLPTGSYEITEKSLEPGTQPHGNGCLSGNVFYYSLDKPRGDFFDTWIYARNVDSDDGVVPVASYLYDQPEGSPETIRTMLAGFFPDGRGGVWTAEYYTAEKEGLRLRLLSADGTEQANIDVTEHLSVFLHGGAFGDYLVLTTEAKALVFRPDGTFCAAIAAESPVLMLTSYRDGPALLVENSAGQLLLVPLDPAAAAFGNTVTLPFSYQAISSTGTKYHADMSSRGTEVYFPCQGNLFACSAADGRVTKLVDWTELGVNPNHVVSQHVGEDGRIVALYRHDRLATGLSLLILTPSETARNADAELTLGVLSSNDNTLELVISHNVEFPESRVRVVNYAEYAAMGQSAQAILRLELARGEGPDMLYSPERDLPVTELAANFLEDLHPFLRQDLQLRQEGLLDSVISVMEENGELLAVTPCFAFSTAISKADVTGTGTLTVSRALNLYDQLATYNSSALETFDRRESVLREHVARNSLLYGVAENHDFQFNNASFQEGLTYAARFPESIDWTRIETFGSTPGWARVREGTQLLLSGEYYGFAALGQDLYAVGDGAVLCGHPDAAGGHVLEIWNTFGMLKGCRDKDAAWSFLRKVLLDETQSTYPLSGFPSNLTTFRQKGEEAMRAEGTRTLVNGEETLEIPGQLSRSQYNAILEAVQKATARYQEDYEVFAAIWPVAQQYFEGKQDLSTTVAAAQNAAKNYHTPTAIR